MNALVYALRTFGRELRSGELLVLFAAVALAVAALTSVGFLTDRIGRAVAQQANEILAADLRLRSPEPIPEEWRAAAAAHRLQTAETQSFPSVVFAGDANALAQVRAVSEGYPLRGELRIADRPFGAERVAAGVPAGGTVWADAALLARLGVGVGDRVALGEADFEVAAVLTYRPDQSIGFASLAPTLLLNVADVPRTGLVSEGSRVGYALLVAGRQADVDDFYAAVEDRLPENVRARTREDSSERATEAADRAERFLSLTAVISVLLSAVAIAMSARRFAHRRMDTVALMKSLGATQAFVLAGAALQLVLVGLLGVAAGSAIGYAAEELLTVLLAGLLEGDLPPAGWTPVLLACGAALVLLAGFALPSLLQLRNTPPLKVLRRDAIPPPPSRLLVAGLSIAAVAALLYRAVPDGRLLAIVLGGLLAVAAALYVTGRLLVLLIGRSRGGVGVAWRYGLANVARRGRDSTVQVVAFGLGLTILLLLSFVRTDLLSAWETSLDEDAPNHFLINIQPDERSSIARIFTQAGIPAPRFVPLVRARMTHIDGESVTTRSYPRDDGEWMANREQNLTFSRALDSSNTIVAGEWWPEDYSGPPLVSVEEDAAADLGVGLGDTLRFLVAGQEVEARITSLRSINWDSFRPNFFLLLSPGALDGFPTTYVSSLRLEKEHENVLLTLVRAHPSVSVIDLGSILAQVRSIIDQASLAVQAVFVFTLAAGIAVLFAAVQSTMDERRYESAMLRALGVRRRTVLSGVLAEFAALGFAAGLLASAGASILAAVLATELFDLDYRLDPLLWTAGLAGGVLLVCLSGYLAARGAVNAPPVDVLRMA